MKKFMFMLAVFFMVRSASACDVCGCAGASGAYFPGSMNRESQFGLTYHYMSFKSRHLPGILTGQQGEERISTERFHLMNLGLRYSFLPKWQAVLQLPYQYVQKQDQGIITTVNGLADMQLGLARYFSLDSLKGIDAWNTVAEYDLKLPTGAYRVSDLSEQISRFMFPGSGSLDHFFRLTSQLRRENWMISLGALYRLNGRGPDQLDWGNRVQGQMDFGRIQKLKNGHEWFYSLGYVYEHSQSDYQQGSELPFSSYSFGQAKASVQWRRDSWAASATGYMPVHGNLADGRVNMNGRFQIQLIYFPKFL